MDRTATLSLPVSLRKYPATRLAECLTMGYGYPGEVGAGAMEAVLDGSSVLTCLFVSALVAVAVAPREVGMQNAEYMSFPFVIFERSLSTKASFDIVVDEPLAYVMVVLGPG